MFEIPSVAQILQSHMQEQHGPLNNIHDFPTWQAAYAPHEVFNDDRRGLSFTLCTVESTLLATMVWLSPFGL